MTVNNIFMYVRTYKLNTIHTHKYGAKTKYQINVGLKLVQMKPKSF